jgi:hypothetical protein
LVIVFSDLHLFTASDYFKRFVHSKINDPGIGLFGTRFTNPYSPSINKQRKKATTGILAKYDQKSMYIHPHNMVDEVSFSLSSFKHASIFFMQKGESMQAKT